MYPCHPRPSVPEPEENSYFAIIETRKKMSCTVKVNGNSAGLFSRRLPCFLACWPSSFCPLKDRAFFVPSSLVNEYAPSWGYGFILPCSSSSKKSSKTLHISLPRSPRFLLCHRLRKVDQTSSAPFCNPITESRMRSYKKKYREKLLKRLLLRTALLQSSNLIIVHLSWCAKIPFFKGWSENSGRLNGIWKILFR